MSKIKFYTSDGQMYFEMEEEKVNKEQKIQELTERIENSQAEIDELKKELEKLQEKPYEISYPEPGTKIYYIRDYSGDIHSVILNSINEDIKHLYDIGLLFDTEEEAEQFKREQALIKKIKCWVKEKNDGWEPDWSDRDEKKFYIYYDSQNKKLQIHTWIVSNILSTLPTLKTIEIAQECIDLFGDEIKEVLC